MARKAKSPPSCPLKLRRTQDVLKAAKRALRAAHGALEGPPDTHDPERAMKLIEEALRRMP